MPRSLDLLHSYIGIGRSESPEVELLTQEAIGEALALLFSSRGLYQKVEVSLDPIQNYLDSVRSGNAKAILAEFSKRPWVPVSSDAPDMDRKRALFFCGIVDGELSDPNDLRPLAFPLPAVKLPCAKCRGDQSFTSKTVLWWDGLTGVYPRLGERTSQIFCLTYQCVHCSDSPITFLVRREGLRLLLCGRSERLRVRVPDAIPRDLRPIVADALSAANESDVFAGFYHLRTFCEHYMKQCLGMPSDARITVEELGKQYNDGLDPRMTSSMPSIKSICERASRFMHERSGTREQFSAMLEEVEGHLVAKGLFARFGPPQGDGER